MRNLIWIALLFVACGGADAPKEKPQDSGPTGVVEAFLDATKAKDAGAFGKLFATSCEGEFKKLAEGKVGPDMLTELQSMFEGASVTGMQVDGVKATVDVDLPNHKRGKETINVIQEGGVWKIVGF